MLRASLTLPLMATLAVTAVRDPAAGYAARQRAQAEMSERVRSPAVPGATEYTYGSDPLQRLDLWLPAGTSRPAPLVLFVHGGGWRRGDKGNATGSAKVKHLLAQGYAVASTNYRLIPAATVEQQAADIVAALAWLRRHAAENGVDPKAIVLMGHSAGAHLVALVATDPRYVNAAGLQLDAIRGVIALDGAGYDVPRQIASGGRFMSAIYGPAFGNDQSRQRALSPITHAAPPNAAAFLLAHVDRPDSKAQSEALAAALTGAGTSAQVAAFEGKGLLGHMAINRSLGEPGYPATAVVDTWLRSVLAAR